MPKKFTIISTLTALGLSTLGTIVPAFAEVTARYVATEVFDYHATIAAEVAETCGTDTSDSNFATCRRPILTKYRTANPSLYASIESIDSVLNGLTVSAYNPYAGTLRFYMDSGIVTGNNPNLQNLVIFWADKSYENSYRLKTYNAYQQVLAWEIGNAILNGEEAPEGIHVVYNSAEGQADWLTPGVEQRVVLEDEANFITESVPSSFFLMGYSHTGGSYYQNTNETGQCSNLALDSECQMGFSYDNSYGRSGTGLVSAQATAEDLALIEKKEILKEAKAIAKEAEEKALAAEAVAKAAEERAAAAEARAEAASAEAATAKSAAETAQAIAEAATANANAAKSAALEAEETAREAESAARAAEQRAASAESRASMAEYAALEAAENARNAELTAQVALERANQIAAESTLIAEEALRVAAEAEQTAAEATRVAEEAKEAVAEANRVAEEARATAAEFAKIAEEASNAADSSTKATEGLMQTIDELNQKISTLSEELDTKIATIGLSMAEIQALAANQNAPALVTNNYVTYSTTEIIKNELANLTNTTEKAENTVNSELDAKKSDETVEIPADYVEVPLAAGDSREEEHQFPWWILAFIFSGIFLILWWFLPIGKRRQKDAD